MNRAAWNGWMDFSRIKKISSHFNELEINEYTLELDLKFDIFQKIVELLSNVSSIDGKIKNSSNFVACFSISLSDMEILLFCFFILHD